MSRDLDQLLHDTAATPRREPDPSGLVRSGRRRRRRRHAAGAASALAAVLAVTAVGLQAWPEPAPQIVDQPDTDRPTEQPTPAPTETAAPGDETAAEPPQAQPVAWPEGPSQTPEDAEAQGVPAEVAALPLAERLQLGRGGVQAPEGLYVTSGLPPDTARALVGDDWDTRLEDGGSPYEYGEILLLDPDTLTITRAWPTAGLTVYSPMVLTDPPVVVAARGADGGEPWTSVIVIDRQTGERRGFVGTLPDDVVTAGGVDSPWVTADWVTRDSPWVFGTALGGTDGRIIADTADGLGLHDPTTLEVVDEILRDDEVVGGLVPAGDATFVESREEPRARFLAVDDGALRIRDDVPAFPGPWVWDADVRSTPTVVSGPVLWRLEGQEWVEAFDGGSHPVALHRTQNATWATGYDWQSGGVLFRDGSLAAERPIGVAHPSRGSGGNSEDVVADRSDGSVLWVVDNNPWVVAPATSPRDGGAATATCDSLQPSKLPSGAAAGEPTPFQADSGPGRSWGKGRDQVVLVTNQSAWAATGGRDEFPFGADVDSPDDSTRWIMAVGDVEGSTVQIRIRDGDCDLLLFTTVSYEDAQQYASTLAIVPDTVEQQ